MISKSPTVRNLFLLFLIAFILKGVVYARKPGYGGTLIFGSTGEPICLDPGVIMDGESARVANAIYETLVEYDAVGDRYKPKLATSWDISPDRKKYTFHLRKNVRFHDGNPFNAGAVKFSWERQRHAAHPFHNPSYGKFIYYRSLWGGYPGNIKEIKIINNYTVQVILYSRSYRFLKEISAIQFAIVSPHAVYKSGGDFYRNPMGTGPFKFVEWRRWHRIVLDANREYWGGRPYLDRLVFEPAPGEKSRRRHMERNRIDMMENPTTDFLYNINVKRKYSNLKTKKMPDVNFSYVCINCQKPPFSNPNVRKALNYAIDKKRILRDINENLPVVPSPYKMLWGLNIGAQPYPLDHNKARKLLHDAGYSGGFKVDLWYPKISRPYLVSPVRVAQGVAQSLEEVGLKVKLRGLKWETYLEKLRYGQHELAITGFVGMNYDPDLYFEMNWDRNNAVFGGTNNSFYRNEYINRLLTSCRFEPDRKNRARNYEKIQKILRDDSPIIPLYYYQTRAVMNKSIHGFSANRKGYIDFSRIWMER